MPLLHVIFILAVIGVFVWVVNLPDVPIDGRYKRLISIVALVVTVLWLLQLFLGGSLSTIRVGSP